MMRWSAVLLERSSGAGVAEWNARIAKAGLTNERELREWLKGQGVTGYAQMLLVMETFGYPDFLTASADELIAGQYDDRPHLLPITNRLIALAESFGETTVQARKGYLSLLTPRRTFAVVKASTKKRVDLGLRLDGVQPSERLVRAPSLANDSINLRIGFTSVEEIDDEATEWFRRAYLESV